MIHSDDIFNSQFNYKKVVQRLLSFRRLYIFCLVLFLLTAFLFNHFTERKYANSTSVYLAQDEKTNFMSSSPSSMMQGFGMFSSQNIIDNEIEILQSFTLTKKVIDNLNLKTTYYAFDKNALSAFLFKTPLVRKEELYNDSPIKVMIDPSVPQTINIPFTVTILNENEFQIEADGKNVLLYNYIDERVVSVIEMIHLKKTTVRFDDEVKTQYFNFRIQKSESFNKNFTNNRNLYFYFNNSNSLVQRYMRSIDVKQITPNATLLNITFRANNPALVTDFLNALTSVYLERSLEKKDRMAMSTVDFIDSQISDVADSLSQAESVLKSFRSSNSIMDLSFQGQEAFTKLNALETEKANLQSQRRYYVYLRDYLANNENVSDLAAPSSMNVADPLLTTLITKMLELNAQRVSLIRDQLNTQNLYLTDINLQIDNLKKTLKENVSNSLNTLNIAVNEVDYRISRLSGQISQMPKTELQLKGIERKFKLSDEIYTFLLQKRSEAQIAKAASMPDYEVVDVARLAVTGQVSPRGTLNYAVAFFLALLFPTIIVLGRDFLNNKLSEPEEVEFLSRYPIIGRIFHNGHRSKQIVNDHPNSSVTESFRALRTNFQFFSEGGKRQVLLLTSSTSGEGKTFCSLNLATVFALNGHRTVLLEFDLRRPKIHQEFGSSNIIGITSFLIDKANIEDIIVPTHIENLDLISAGPAAPNPAELINSDRTAELVEKLKEIYDFIIIDSAPAGILTETLLLMKYADLNIFVARMDKTVRDVFRNALRTVENNKFENVSILINDLNVKRDAHKYGYDTKYYTDDRKKGLFSWLRRK